MKNIKMIIDTAYEELDLKKNRHRNILGLFICKAHPRPFYGEADCSLFMLAQGSTEIKRVNIKKVANSRVLTTFVREGKSRGR